MKNSHLFLCLWSLIVLLFWSCAPDNNLNKLNEARGKGNSAPKTIPIGASGQATEVFEVPVSPTGAPMQDYVVMGHPYETNGPIDGAEFNGWVSSTKDNLSTFAADVDTGSYVLARASLQVGEKPDAKSVRVEEFVNYFPYPYEQPQGDDIFAISIDGAASPYGPEQKLLRIGIQGKSIPDGERKPSNLVFLVDVSGSMSGEERLALAKTALETLVNNLHDDDYVAIVTYAGSSQVVLPSTSAADRDTIVTAIRSLQAGGSTAMGDGIVLAYQEAAKRLELEGVNHRVIILSDGDANVGLASHDAILETIALELEKGIYLTTVGFGMGNYRDDMMEQLANKGNGAYYYVDSLKEANRVFKTELTGTLQVIAKDLKIQVEFNKERVSEYRLLGFENRDIADSDFRNDPVDAGDIGAGHQVTALYEVKIADKKDGELLKINLRYKDPEDDKKVSEKNFTFNDVEFKASLREAPEDFRLAACAASFAEILRKSPYLGAFNLNLLADEIAADHSESAQELYNLVVRAK